MTKPAHTIADLLYLMSRLRDPETGCPWDLQQTPRSLVPFLLEEAHEVVDTIERNDLSHLVEELGDLLFQVVFHARLGAEQELFDFDDIVDTLVTKLVSRHPHVFPEGTLESRREPGAAVSQQEISATWEQKKRDERAVKGHQSPLADIPLAAPALTRAQKVQKRAARVGFDWTDVGGVMDKVREELVELESELASSDVARMEDELGDLLFTVVNLARHLRVDAETALRRATGKFERRFLAMERMLESDGLEMERMSPQQLDACWTAAKKQCQN